MSSITLELAKQRRNIDNTVAPEDPHSYAESFRKKLTEPQPVMTEESEYLLHAHTNRPIEVQITNILKQLANEVDRFEIKQENSVKIQSVKDNITEEQLENTYKKYRINYLRFHYDFVSDSEKQRAILRELAELLGHGSFRSINGVDREIAKRNNHYKQINMLRTRFDYLQDSQTEALRAAQSSEKSKLIEKHAAERTKLLEKITQLLSIDKASTVDQIDKAIALQTLLQQPLNYHKKRGRARYHTLEKLFNIVDTVETDDVKNEVAAVIFHLFEAANPHTLNTESLNNDNIRTIVQHYNRSKNFHKARVAQLITLRYEFAASSDVLYQSRLARLIAKGLGLKPSRILQHKSSKKKLAKIDALYKEYDISIPNYNPEQQHINALIAMLGKLYSHAKNDETLKQLDNSKLLHVISQLAINRHLTDHILVEQAISPFSGLVDSLLYDNIQASLSFLRTGKHDFQAKQSMFLTLATYIKTKGTITKKYDPETAKLLSLLDITYKKSDQYHKTFGPTGLHGVYYLMQDPKKSDTQKCQLFFDYVLNQIEFLQNVDLKELDKNNPEYNQLNFTYVRRLKSALNQFARKKGLTDRHLKTRTIPEIETIKIQQLMSLLTEEDRSAYRNKLYRIIARPNETKEELTLQDIDALKGLSHEKIIMLNELKQQMQAKIKNNNADYNREASVENNTLYLIKKLTEIDQKLYNTAYDHYNEIKQADKFGSGERYQFMLKLRKRVLARLIDYNEKNKQQPISYFSMNPVGNIEPNTPKYKLANTEKKLSHTRKKLQKEKKAYSKFGLAAALVMGVFQAFLTYYALQFLLPLLGWVALPVVGLASLASLQTNSTLVTGENKELLHQLAIIRDPWQGFTNPGGKLLMGLTYAAALGFASVIGFIIYIAVIGAPIALPALLVTGLAVVGGLSTFIGFGSLMAYSMSKTWQSWCVSLENTFPEIRAYGWGFVGLIKGTVVGIGRFFKEDVNKRNFNHLLDRFKRYWQNPTGNPAADTRQIVYQHIENIFKGLFKISLLAGAAYLCFHASVAMVEAWSSMVTSTLLEFGVPAIITTVSTFVGVNIIANFVNTFFNIQVFKDTSLSIADVLAKAATAVLIKLPEYVFYRGPKKLFAKSTEKKASSKPAKLPGEGAYKAWHKTLAFVKQYSLKVVDGLAILLNASGFAGLTVRTGFEAGLPKPVVIRGGLSTITTSISANQGAYRHGYSIELPSNVPLSRSQTMITELANEPLQEDLSTKKTISLPVMSKSENTSDKTYLVKNTNENEVPANTQPFIDTANGDESISDGNNKTPPASPFGKANSVPEALKA